MTCGADHVTELTLQANNLSGSLPAALGDLSQLNDLDLADNQLTGAIPTSLGNLSALELPHPEQQSSSAAQSRVNFSSRAV